MHYPTVWASTLPQIRKSKSILRICSPSASHPSASHPSAILASSSELELSEMPRPHVKPEDRQRVANACAPCKTSKKRCDATTPCTPCIKKGQPESCTYTTRRSRLRATNLDREAHAGASREAASTLATISRQGFERPLSGAQYEPPRADEAADEQHAVTLSSASGEKGEQ